ncbi:TPA_asm: hypothetical protein G1U61_15110 [Salmonella enterica subsp. enterica serovar Typhi str. CT18]|nr:hypothetical protein [Salmonella enterica subsp. enterica serovar Typhi str. CT18]
MALAAIRKSNNRHVISLFAVVTHTQDHIQRENEFIDSELCIHLANHCQIGAQPSTQTKIAIFVRHDDGNTKKREIASFCSTEPESQHTTRHAYR